MEMKTNTICPNCFKPHETCVFPPTKKQSLCGKCKVECYTCTDAIELGTNQCTDCKTMFGDRIHEMIWFPTTIPKCLVKLVLGYLGMKRIRKCVCGNHAVLYDDNNNWCIDCFLNKTSVITYICPNTDAYVKNRYWGQVMDILFDKDMDRNKKKGWIVSQISNYTSPLHVSYLEHVLDCFIDY